MPFTFLGSLVFKFIGSAREREFSAVGNRASIHFDEMRDKVIEAGSQVMDSVTDDCAKSERERFRDSRFDDPIAGLWLIISDLSIRITR